MRCLLDTHTAFWYFEGSSELSTKAKTAIEDSGNEIFVSIVSAWEVAIKVSLGKLDFKGGVTEFLSAIEANNIRLIGIHGDYVKTVETLPLIHRDPFDRLIIATALSENMTVITIDENVHKYGVSWFW